MKQTSFGLDCAPKSTMSITSPYSSNRARVKVSGMNLRVKTIAEKKTKIVIVKKIQKNDDDYGHQTK